jgi:hypothetical protein
MRSLTLPTVAAALLGGGLAHASALTPSHDTYVRRDNSGPYGTEAHLYVKNAGSNATTRKALLRFDGVETDGLLDVSLALDVSTFNDTGGATRATFYVFGIQDASVRTGCGEDFDERTLLYKALGYLDDSSDGVKNDAACVFGGAPLGVFTVTSGDLGKTVRFSSDALSSFVTADTSGRVTLLLTRHENSGSFNTGFASKEHGRLQPPRLVTTSAADVVLVSPGGAVANPDGSVRYTGALRIPVAGGDHVTLPGANVTMTFSASGRLRTISGTVGLPELPGLGLFGLLGALEGTGPALQIGFDQPAAFDTLGLPLQGGSRYFYLRRQTGTTVTWGPISASSPDASASLLVIEPAAPAFFVATDALPFEGPIDALAIGVAAGNHIPFTPWYDAGVTAYLTPFGGDVYLGGTVILPTRIPGVEAVVTGDLTIDASDEAFASGQPQDWFTHLGVNGELALETGLGIFTLSSYLGGGSLLYRRSGDGGQPSLAFAGVVDPDRIRGLPLTTDGSASIAGYLTARDGGKASFVELRGDLKFGTAFTQQKISATVRVTPTGASLSGKARFGGTNMNVSGAVHASYATFTGSISHRFDFAVGQVKTTVKGSFDSRKASVSLSATAKFCVAGSCESVGIKELTVRDSGSIRICVQVPGYGTACDTI